MNFRVNIWGGQSMNNDASLCFFLSRNVFTARLRFITIPEVHRSVVE